MSATERRLVAYVGPMFACKTLRLIVDLDRAQRQGKTVVAFKPMLDDRYSTHDLASHAGDRFPAVPVDSTDGMLEHLANMDKMPAVVGIDELFMLKGAADFTLWLYKQGVSVIVASLDLSHACKPFPEIIKLLPFATEVNKLSAVCAACGSDALYTHKKAHDCDLDLRVGGDELYEPRCVRCHPAMIAVD